MSSQQPAANPSTSTSTPQPPPAKPPIELPSSSLIADNVQLRGHNPVTIGRHTLVHPRAYLYSSHGPINIGSHTTIFPKATIGGPIPSSTTAPLPPSHATPKPTTIGSHVQVHPHTVISHSSTIHDYAQIESHCTLLPGSSVGAHSKICSGITISSSVPKWTVVFGNGEMRRSRRNHLDLRTVPPNGSGNGDGDDKSISISVPLASNEAAHPTTSSSLNATETPAIGKDTAGKSSHRSSLHPLFDKAESQRVQNQSLEAEATISLLRTHTRPPHVTGQATRRPAPAPVTQRDSVS